MRSSVEVPVQLRDEVKIKIKFAVKAPCSNLVLPRAMEIRKGLIFKGNVSFLSGK